VLRPSAVIAEFSRHGYRVCSAQRPVVLPIALHEAGGRLSLTRSVEAARAAAGLARGFGSPMTLVAER
jgi:hypothetical protein